MRLVIQNLIDRLQCLIVQETVRTWLNMLWLLR
jgi:hypothetical protein